MGGDGGVIASNRKYLRGAGQAECTADSKRHLQQQNETQQQIETMTTCAVSKETLDFTKNHQIVTCPHGLLYNREAALEALLRRKTHETSELGAHVRGLKDLHQVFFETKQNSAGVAIPVCPVTGLELNGKVPAYVLVGTSKRPNVVSERAQKEIGKDALEIEYGPFDEMIRLAPPSSMLEQIDKELHAKRDKQDAHKKKKKRKKNNHSKEEQVVSTKKTKTTVADAARTRVEKSVKSNAVLSSLFTSDKSRSISEKEKKDNLFAR